MKRLTMMTMLSMALLGAGCAADLPWKRTSQPGTVKGEGTGGGQDTGGGGDQDTGGGGQDTGGGGQDTGGGGQDTGTGGGH
jgi:hypothetical protein